MAAEYVEHVWETATALAPAHWSSTRKKEWVEAVRRRTEVDGSVTGEFADRHEEWERHLGERDLCGHAAEAQWPLAGDRQRVSVTGR